MERMVGKMANTNSVKDPKNGVVSCWVCTGVLILFYVMRLSMLRMDNKIIDWTFIVLIIIWIIISAYQTIKYRKSKKGMEHRDDGETL